MLSTPEYLQNASANLWDGKMLYTKSYYGTVGCSCLNVGSRYLLPVLIPLYGTLHHQAYRGFYCCQRPAATVQLCINYQEMLLLFRYCSMAMVTMTDATDTTSLNQTFFSIVGRDDL